jgi:hypothetical protein
MKKPKTTEKMPLHQFIATGGDVSKFRGSKGINKNTVPNVKSKS